MIDNREQIEPAAGVTRPPRPTRHAPHVQYWRWAIAARNRPIPLARTLQIGDAVFNAVTSTCWALSGHRRLPLCLHGPRLPRGVDVGAAASTAGAAGPWRHEHAFILPEDIDGDGFLDHVCVAATMGLDPAALRLLAATDRLIVDGQVVALVAERMGPLRDFEVLGQAWLWISSTPYVPPNRRPTGPKDAVKQLRYEIGRRELPTALAALPRPISELRIGGNTLRPDAFDLTRTDGERLPVDSRHFFELTFTAPISGPLAFGWSCHRGLGQFVPVPPTGAREMVRDGAS